jgi:tyrosyl-tRNA synthetase
MNFVEELKWRGMLHDMMPGTEELLAKEQVTAYIGFDPTADSLHIGHLCSVMILRHFQRCGHKPLALIGGATGMIGDPSGKSAERNLLTEETLQRNMAGMKKQLSKFLDFDSDAPNRAELVNNMMSNIRQNLRYSGLCALLQAGQPSEQLSTEGESP